MAARRENVKSVAGTLSASSAPSGCWFPASLQAGVPGSGIVFLSGREQGIHFRTAWSPERKDP